MIEQTLSFAYWHFRPEHREIGKDGKWHLLSGSWMDPEKKLWPSPPPSASLDQFIEQQENERQPLLRVPLQASLRPSAPRVSLGVHLPSSRTATTPAASTGRTTAFTAPTAVTTDTRANKRKKAPPPPTSSVSVAKASSSVDQAHGSRPRLLLQVRVSCENSHKRSAAWKGKQCPCRRSSPV